MPGVWQRLPLPAPHAVALGVALLLQVRTRDRRLPAVVLQAGWPVLAAGVGLTAWAVVVRGPGDLEQPSRLVTGGPYAFSRNPMYVGWSLVHLGLGAVARSPWAVASWPLAVVLVHRDVLAEERAMVVRFGAEMQDYLDRVPRYWGRPVARSDAATGVDRCGLAYRRNQKSMSPLLTR